MAKANAVIVAAVESLTDTQIKRLAFHLTNKTPFAFEDGTSALAALATKMKVQVDGEDGTTVIYGDQDSESWQPVVKKMDKVTDYQWYKVANSLNEKEVRQSVRTAVNRRLKKTATKN